MRECPECGGKFPDDTGDCPKDGSPLGPEGAADVLLGTLVGSYTLSKCLGRGGMGAVYQADHPTIGSKVAVKFLHRKYAADRAIVERFFNEARAVNLIGHDNIVKVSDFSQLDDGSPYFIMEFLEGRALSALLGQPRGLEETGPILLQVADGLQAAHDKGIIHRDLKPDNIYLVTRNRRANFVKVVDFGIAKLQGSQAGTGKTATGMVMGTAQYMSPEQASGEVSKIGPGSDIYSLGVIMYQLATGRLPFEGQNFGELLIGHLMKPPQAPRELNPEIPEAYEQIILRCLAKRPEERFSSMFELYEALGALLDQLGMSREPPLAGSTRPSSGAAGKSISRPPLATPPATTTKPAGPQLHERATRAMPAGKGGTVINQAAEEGTVALYEPRKKSSSNVGSIAAVVIAIVVLGGGAAAFVLHKPAPLPAAPSAPIAATVPASPKPALPATVHVAVVSTPPGASLTIEQGDQVLSAVTPANLELKRDVQAKAHLEADGFTAQTEVFQPTRDTELRYVLVAVPKKPAEEVVVKAPAAEKPVVKPAMKKPAKNVGDGMVDVDL